MSVTSYWRRLSLRYGLTPLHYAAYENSLQVAQLLIDNGANKNIKDIEGRKKPIDYARSRGHSEMVALLQ